MKIVFLNLMFMGNMLDSAMEDSKTPVQMATHVFQTNLLNGLKNIPDVVVNQICVPPIGSYPFHYKRLVIGKKEYMDGVQVGYINLPYLKQWMQMRKIYKRILFLLNHNQCDCLLVYSLFPPFLEVAWRIKRLFPKCEICLIQTDAVPGYNDAPKYMTKHNIRKGKWLIKKAECCDNFVLLTKYLIDPLEVKNRSYTIVECICDSKQPKCDVNNSSRNICLYTGVLDKIYNIVNLVKAFEKMPNAQLWLCGDGDAVGEIQTICARCSNIKYFGYVNQIQLQVYRNQCDFLINPRVPEGTYTLYSFPSKTAEYMMSGKPTIMYKLEGIPDEYDEYLNYLTGRNTEKMIEELEQIFEIDYSLMVAKAQRARKFMLDNKTEKKQAEKIVDMLRMD